MMLSDQELIHLKKLTLSKDKKVPLLGFVSTSTSREFVEKKLCEAVTKEEMDFTPVIMEIKLTNLENSFVLNQRKFSHFSEDEEEVILQDGIELKVERPLYHKPIGAK